MGDILRPWVWTDWEGEAMFTICSWGSVCDLWLLGGPMDRLTGGSLDADWVAVARLELAGGG